MSGSASFDFMRPAAEQIAETIPDARYQELPDQRHDVDAKVIAPILADFFCTATAGVGR
jgi:hypothetical protein